MTGYTAEDIVGKTPRVLQSGQHDAAFYRAMWERIHAAGSWQGEIWNRRKNGETFPNWMTITAVKNADGAVTHYVGTQSDITLRKAAEKQIYELAFFDPLTNLPNRRMMLDRLEEGLAQAKRFRRSLAVMFLDIDRFKQINDTFGHDVGDQLLKEVSKRLSSCVRSVDTVSRPGGDEFVIVLPEISNPRDSTLIAEKIVAAIREPVCVGHQVLNVTTSIGIAVFAVDGSDDAQALMKKADAAMYAVKSAGRNGYQLFGDAAPAAH
jgi:diguanylate cyclase (GGDEF)-like protein/PAS domain S-box-containing protein